MKKVIHFILAVSLSFIFSQKAFSNSELVTPDSSVSIQFDANNPGVWPLHCHVLYHLEAGMLTVLRYNNFIQPLVPLSKG